MTDNPHLEQQPLFEEEGARSLLDQLLTNSRLNTTGKDYQELLDFVAKLPNFSPFNAMLLQIQKLGLRFAASAYDWNRIFRRTIEKPSTPIARTSVPKKKKTYRQQCKTLRIHT